MNQNEKNLELDFLDFFDENEFSQNNNPELQYVNLNNHNRISVQKKTNLNNIDEIKLEEKIFVILEQIRITEENLLNQIRKLQDNRRVNKRSEKDQCMAINRKGKRCQGYVCKKSEHLCFAHRLIARKESINSHLYQKRTPNSFSDTPLSFTSTPTSQDNECNGNHGGISLRDGSHH